MRRPPVLLVLLFVALALPALAATFTVNATTSDDDGACDAAPGGCTIREAIDAANGTPGRDEILFDPAVFSDLAPSIIAPTSELPPLSDPAGVVVDGRNAVALDGSALGGAANGLVVQSGAGVPLGGVAIRNLEVSGFPGHGLLVCGGVAPGCNASISKARIAGIVSRFNEADGIHVAGGMIRAGVSNCTAAFNGGSGVHVVSSDASRDTGNRIARVFADENVGHGIYVEAENTAVAPRGERSHASHIRRSRTNENGGNGIRIGLAIIRHRVRGNLADGNVGDDLVDQNPFCGSNRWSGNLFTVANQSCVE
jgi:CSLREA domain-containing protein